MTNLLCTSVGNDGFPAVYKAVKKANDDDPIAIIGTDIRENAAGLYIADKFSLISKRDHPDHLDHLRKIIDEHKIDILLPLSTEDQLFYAQNKEELSVPIITSQSWSIDIANNKFKLLKYIESCGGQDWVPGFQKIDGPKNIAACAEKLGFPEKKVVFKVDQGTGAQGLKIISQKISGMQRIMDRDNRDVGMNEFQSWAEDVVDWPESHFVEYLPGDEYSVDVLCRKGEILSIVSRKRLASMYGLATEAVVVDESDLEEAATFIASKLQLDYVVNIQFRRDDSGAPKLMEINPRIPGTIGLTVESGVNMPYLAIQMALGKTVGPPVPRIGTKIIRIWDGIYL